MVDGWLVAFIGWFALAARCSAAFAKASACASTSMSACGCSVRCGSASARAAGRAKVVTGGTQMDGVCVGTRVGCGVGGLARMLV